MDETELISTIQSEISSVVNVPVKTSGLDDERPVPVVLIEDWDTQDKNFHNSPPAGDCVGDINNDGKKEYEKYHNFYFKTRVEFAVRHYDEVEVSRLKNKVKNKLRLIRDDPQGFHEGLKELALASGGNPTNRFTEPKEAELMLAARFHGDHTITVTGGDQIEALNEQFKFNQ